MKKELLDRLKKYALSAGALSVSATAADAQINYTDVNPDSTVTGAGNNYMLDLNNDNTADFDISIQSTQSTFTSTYYSYSSYFATVGIRINPLGANAVKNDSSSYPYALNSGANVNAGGNWNGSSGQILAANVIFSFGSGNYTSSAGNWIGATDKYLGLRIVVSGQTYYGWARLTVNAFDEFTIKDYAIRTTANTAILTGDTADVPVQVFPAINLQASDVSNNEDASDFRVTFNHATNETGIQQYRVMVVKDSNASTFDLAAAQAVVFPNYNSALVSGNSTTFNLLSTQTDVDGDLIVEDVPYRFFVLSKADGTNAQIDSLSANSNVVTLTHPIAPPPIAADTVQNIVLADIANYANGRDVQASFNMVADESTVGEYRIIIVKSGVAGSFTLNQAETLIAGRYTTVVPNGSNVVKVLFDTSKDSDGNLIVANVPYRAFVMSLADGNNAVANSISTVSNEITLNEAIGIVDINASDAFSLTQTAEEITVSSLTGDNIRAIRLYNINGQLVNTASGSGSSLSINSADHATGVYYLEAESSREVVRTKLFVP